MSTSRPFIVAANWKMHKSPREAVEFLKAFIPQVQGQKLAADASSLKEGRLTGQEPRQVVIFIPAINLWVSEQMLRASGLGWGAQNVHFESKGAFTGENSPQVLKELGATHALVGHSERRALFHESLEDTTKKVAALQALELIPMLCVGESLQEREEGRTGEVIIEQLRAGLAKVQLARPVVIAYEPVWAIGTGKVATPEQANEAHQVLRSELQKIGGPALAERTPILYGGSVKPDNAKQIASQSDVDGFLVGGASLEVESFLALCQTTK